MFQIWKISQHEKVIFKYICNFVQRRKNVKKIGEFLGTNISRTTKAISFNFGMWSCAYVRQKIYKFGLVVLEIQMAEFGNFTVPVNNTPVCHTSSFIFLATDTLLCVLIIRAKSGHLPGHWFELSGHWVMWTNTCMHSYHSSI